jgi:hypothetical protein
MARAVVCAFFISAAVAQQVTLLPAPAVSFPAETDSNSPAFWNDQGLVLYNSTGLGPIRSAGADQYHLWDSEPVTLGSTHRPYWIEATWTDADGTVFAWYHHEPGGLCGKARVTAPEIGALVSYDGGQTFYDLGIVLENGYGIDCSSPNGFFGGGNGDFTVVLGPWHRFFYFLFSNYGGPVEEQGVAIARMPFEQRFSPVGAVHKYYQNRWQEPGIGGSVTPIFPAGVSWQEAQTDAFWGPSVHWNSYLNKFVMLLNHSCCSPGWPQEGIYVSFSDSLATPSAWTAPAKILEGGGWYPQVLGRRPDGTDKLAGHSARFYLYGVSNWEIIFDK